jgi:hypothetical protein
MMTRFHIGHTYILFAVSLLFCVACDDAEEFQTDSAGFPEDSPARYFGKLQTVSGAPTISGDTELYEFRQDVPAEPIPADVSPGDPTVPAIGRGPSCLTGEPYRVLAQRGSGEGSNNLLIQTDEGGACFVNNEIEDNCLITSLEAATAWPTGGEYVFLSPSEEDNPLTHDWNRVFLPACDGSLYAGDTNALPATGRGEDEFRYYRGSQNFTAGMQIAKQMVPNPDKIFITGYIGGAYGAVINTAMAVKVFPEADIYVYTASGSLMANRVTCTCPEEICPPDDEDCTCTSSEEVCEPDPDFLQRAVEDYNAEYYIPDVCGEDCLDNGSLYRAASSLINAANDEGNRKLRAALATSVSNFVVVNIFLKFTTTELLNAYVESFYDAFNEFEDNIPEGTGAAFLLDGSSSVEGYDAEIGEITLEQWLTDFLNDAPGWSTVAETPTE